LKPAHFKLSQNKDQAEMLATKCKSLRDKRFRAGFRHWKKNIGATMYDCATLRQYCKNEKPTPVTMQKTNAAARPLQKLSNVTTRG